MLSAEPRNTPAGQQAGHCRPGACQARHCRPHARARHVPITQFGIQQMIIGLALAAARNGGSRVTAVNLALVAERGLRYTTAASDRRTVAAGRDEYPVHESLGGRDDQCSVAAGGSGLARRRPSMRRRTPYPAGRKPACSQNGRDNGLAVSKSTETHW